MIANMFCLMDCRFGKGRDVDSVGIEKLLLVHRKGVVEGPQKSNGVVCKICGKGYKECHALGQNHGALVFGETDNVAFLL